MLIRLGCSHTVGAAESVSLHLAAGHSVVAVPPWRADPALAAEAPRRPRAGRNGRQTLALAPGARQSDRSGACGVRRDRTALAGAAETADRLDSRVQM